VCLKGINVIKCSWYYKHNQHKVRWNVSGKFSQVPTWVNISTDSPSSDPFVYVVDLQRYSICTRRPGKFFKDSMREKMGTFLRKGRGCNTDWSTVPLDCCIVCLIKTNLMHYLSSVSFVNQPLHVSGIFVAHHQEVYFIYTKTGRFYAF
jgi:hypothetical protein